MRTEVLQDTFKKAMGNYPTGVTLITTISEEGSPIGLIANSFTSLSMDPALVLWSIDHKVSTYGHFMHCKDFAVHILAAEQGELLKDFTKKKKKDRFANVEWILSRSNIPIVKDTLAVIECEIYNKMEAGDHTIIVGKIKEISVEDKEPLLYHRRTAGAIPQEFYPEKETSLYY